MFTRKPFFALTALAIIFPALVSAQQQARIDNSLEARIKRIENGLLPQIIFNGEIKLMTIAERLAHHKNPGISIAVINNNKIEWARGYGFVESGKPAPVTPQTLFQAASISKPVAVVGALRMVEAGRLSLDEDVNKKLTSWKVPDNEFTATEKVTLRRLATHSAGLTVHGFDGYKMGGVLPAINQILNGESPANSPAVRVDYIPGSRSRYSGGGLTVLQLLMSDTANKAFPELMNDLVLSRIGMKNSTYEQPLPARLQAQAAVGHDSEGRPIEGKWHVYPEMAAAGLWTTPTDLALLTIEVQKANLGQSKKVLSQMTAKQMLTYQIDEAGLGFFLKGRPVPFRLSHNGANEGFRCILVGYFDRGQGAVIMTNSDNGSDLMMELLRAVAAEYGWDDLKPDDRKLVTVSEDVLKTYVGEYQAPENGPRFTVTLEGGKLFIQQTQRAKLELFAETENTFYFMLPGPGRFVFSKNAEGNIDKLILRQGANERQAAKVK